MCTVIRNDQVDNSTIASEDFIVYKFGEMNSVGDFISDFMKHRYCPDTVYHVTMKFQNGGLPSDDVERKYMETLEQNERIFVTQGFHAYTSLKRLMQNSLAEFNHVAEFVVPKHARYYINDCGNIVSSDIMFKRFI